MILNRQVYDWLVLFDREVEYIWKKEWNVAKMLYIFSRYGPFLDAPIGVVRKSDPALIYRWGGGNIDRGSGVF